MSKKKNLLIALVLSALLYGCQAKDDTIPIDLSEYVIVRSDTAGKEDVALAVSLRNRLNDAGIGSKLTTDYLDRAGKIKPSEYELLFGQTNRDESESALSELEGENSFIVKLVGTRLVVMAKKENAYNAAIDWILENVGEDQTLNLPEGGYHGRWTPEFEGLVIDGTPIGEFRIVCENVLGFGFSEAAEMLADSFYELTGERPVVASSESEPTAHEIYLGTKSGQRGEIAISGENRQYFEARFNNYLQSLKAGNAKGDFKMNEANKITLKVDGKDPVERGNNLRAAIDEVKASAKTATAENPLEYVLLLSGGEYDLPGGITFGENPFTKLTIKAADRNDRPIITGLVRIPDESFTKVEGTDYYMAKLGLTGIRDFYINGKRLPLAKGEMGITAVDFDNADSHRSEENTHGIYVDRSLAENLEFNTTEIDLYIEWEAFRIHAVGIDPNDTKIVDGKELVRLKFSEDDMKFFPTTVQNRLINRPYFFGNDLSLISGGSCVADYNNGVVYYFPESGRPENVSYSTTDVILKFSDASDITLEDLDFYGTSCSTMVKDGYFAGQANNDKRNGNPWFAAVNFENCTNVRISGCDFSALNGNGVRSEGYVKGLTVENCSFDDIAMSAISVGRYTTDWTHETACYDITINNNTISNIGTDYPASTAIYISHGDGIKLTHNTIENCSYTGISVGWGWTVVDYEYGEKINVRDAEIAYNKIMNCMEKLRDGAAIYVLGANCTEKYTELFNTMHDNYAEKADYKPDTGHICGYYLDGSSSNWHVYDNVISGAKYPLFTQFHVKEQYNHNVLCEEIYSASPIAEGNNCPERNVILGKTYVEGSIRKLLETYPKAKSIFENSGAK